MLIVTATDFSEVAENAVAYACKLAAAQNARVMIIHSFVIPVMFSDVPMPGSLITDAQNDAEEQMAKLVAAMTAANPGITVNGKVIYGDTVDVLDDVAGADSNPWMIVVGNSGPGEAGSWPDSTLMNVFKKMEHPVLAVPPKYGYGTVRKVCFAFDNKHKGTDAALAQLTELAQRLHAELHVLTIQPRTAEGSSVDIDGDAQHGLAAANPIYHSVYDTEDIDKAIKDFTAKNNIDWLIMIPRKHSFFEGIFHKSHIKAIAHDSAIPILALHEHNA
jgi:nucleotide-binding universal stress UspA family protein